MIKLLKKQLHKIYKVLQRTFDCRGKYNIISRTHLSYLISAVHLNEIFATSHWRSIRFDDKKHEDSCTSRVLIVFSRKPPDIMEYRRSEKRIMSKTNEARRNKRPSPFLASEKGSRRCCCPARKMEGEFSRARPLVKSSHLLSSLRTLAAALVFVLLSLACARKGGKGRRRVVKCGEKLRREGTTTTMKRGGDSCRVGTKPINTFALKLPRVQGRGIVVLSQLWDAETFLTLISVIVRTYIFT